MRVDGSFLKAGVGIEPAYAALQAAAVSEKTGAYAILPPAKPLLTSSQLWHQSERRPIPDRSFRSVIIFLALMSDRQDVDNPI